jgi:hypothetical protein
MFEGTVTHNKYPGDSADVFICEKCNTHIEGYVQINEDSEHIVSAFRPKFCPNCGRKVLNEKGGN